MVLGHVALVGGGIFFFLGMKDFTYLFCVREGEGVWLARGKGWVSEIIEDGFSRQLGEEGGGFKGSVGCLG